MVAKYNISSATLPRQYQRGHQIKMCHLTICHFRFTILLQGFPCLIFLPTMGKRKEKMFTVKKRYVGSIDYIFVQICQCEGALKLWIFDQLYTMVLFPCKYCFPRRNDEKRFLTLCFQNNFSFVLLSRCSDFINFIQLSKSYFSTNNLIVI